MTQDVVLRIRENDMAKVLAAIFDDLPKELVLQLDEAQDRYMHVIGITRGAFDDDQIENDRIKYSVMSKNASRDGKTVFIDDDCVDFMTTVYCLPKLLCRMQVTNDFNWAAASGFTPVFEDDINVSCDSLKPYLQDDDLLKETASFLIKRGLLASL